MAAKAEKVKTKMLSAGSREAGASGCKSAETVASTSHPGSCPQERDVQSLAAASGKGFTLIEVLVVLALLAALTAVVAPSVGRGFGAIELQTSARQVAATLRLARMKAVREQQVVGVGFDIQKNEIEIIREDLAFRRTFELPDSIRIERVVRKGEEPLSNEKVTCLFIPNGLSESLQVWLRNKRGRQIKVVQDSMFKSPRIEPAEEVDENSGR